MPGNDIYNDETDYDNSKEVISELSVSHGPKMLYEYTEGLKQFIKSKHRFVNFLVFVYIICK